MSQINFNKTSTNLPVPAGKLGLKFNSAGELCKVNENGTETVLINANQAIPNILANRGVGLEADLPGTFVINDVYVTSDTYKVFLATDSITWVSTDLIEGVFITDLVPENNVLYQFDGVSIFTLASVEALLLDQTTPQTVINGSPTFRGIKFDLAPEHVLDTGEAAWNEHDLTVNIKASSNVTLQVNQEQTIPVINRSGVPIVERTLCRIVDYDETTEYFVIEPSSNASEEGAIVDGMLTQTLDDDEFGLLTVKGQVRNISTVGATNGAFAYLGSDGFATPTKPSYPAKVVIIGKYGRIDGTQGNILVDTSSAYQEVINDINTTLDLKATQNVGICSQCPILVNDIVIDTTALTLAIATIKGGQTISPANPIRFFIDGGGAITKYEKTTAQSASFTNTTGKWYIYFNANGDLVASQTPWSDFNIISAIFRFDWDATLSGAARLIEEIIEMHTNTISADDHAHKHAGGTINIKDSGLLINNAITTGSPNVDGRNTVISLTDVENMDDNLPYKITNVHPATAAAYFEQDLGIQTAGSLTLSNSALLPIRINNISGQRSFLPATRFPFAWNVATNRPEYITSSGVRTLVADDRYFVYYIYSIQDRKIGQAVRLVSAEVDFTSITLARAHSIETLQGLYADMRDNEIRPLYKLIFLFNDTVPSPFDVAVKYTRLHEILDIRKTKGVAVTASAGSIPATNVTELTDGNVQTALDNVRANMNSDIYIPTTQPVINTGTMTLDCVATLKNSAMFEGRTSVETLTITDDFTIAFDNLGSVKLISLILTLTGTNQITFPNTVMCSNPSLKGVWLNNVLTLSSGTGVIVEFQLIWYASASKWQLKVSEEGVI